MAYLSSSFLLCLLFITEAIGNPVIFTNRANGQRQKIPNQFLPSNFKDFLDVDYIFLPDLSKEFDAFDYESAPLDQTGNKFFPSIEFGSKRSREEDELKKTAVQNIFPSNEIVNKNRKTDGLTEIHSQASPSSFIQSSVSSFQQPAASSFQQNGAPSFQQPAVSSFEQPAASSFQKPASSTVQQLTSVVESRPVADEQSRSDRLLSSIIGGIKKDIFPNQPVNNRIVQQDRNKDTLVPSRKFPAALQVSESISVPAKVAAPEIQKNNIQTQSNSSRSQNLFSMIVKGIHKDIFPNNDKQFEPSAPQSISGTQTFVQNSQPFRPGREENVKRFEHPVPQSIPGTQTFVPNPQSFRPGREENVKRFEHPVPQSIPGTQIFFPNPQSFRPGREENVKRFEPSAPQPIPGTQTFIQNTQSFRPGREENVNRFEHSVPQSIPGTQTFVPNPQSFRPGREENVDRFEHSAPQSISGTQTFVPNPQSFRPGRGENVNRFEHSVPQTIPGTQTFFQSSQSFRPGREDNNKRFEHSVPQTIPATQTFVHNSQSFRPGGEDFTFQTNPSIISEHIVIPSRRQQVPETLEPVIHRQEHFHENRQQTSNFSRSQLLLGNILSSIQRDIFNRQRFI